MKNLLVDTSAWIEYFKARESVMNIIHDARNFRVLTSGPIVSELLLGFRTEREMKRFAACFQALPILDVDKDIWAESGMVGNALKRKGMTVPMADLILHCVAHRHGCAILTFDSHFRQMNELLASDLEIITPI